jgi:carboxypeptidase C (cathepsin A)
VRPWSFGDYANRYLNMAETLREAMTRNPHLKVLAQSGYYDFATPYFDSVYTLDHLGLPAALRGNVRFELYESGHMMYIRRADHEKLRKDVADFILWAAGGSAGGR